MQSVDHPTLDKEGRKHRKKAPLPKLPSPEIQKEKFLPTLPSLLAKPGIPLIHRDISWLQFNKRVLEQARPSSQNFPIERVKFLAISATNLDEFFMIRLASLNRDILMSKSDPKELAELERVRSLLLEEVLKFGARQSEIFELLSAELASLGIYLVGNPKESADRLKLGQQVFEQKVLPNLGVPDTFSVQSLSALDNLDMAVVYPDGLWYRVPRSMPSVFSISSEKDQYFFFLDRLLLTYLKKTFKSRGAPGIVRLSRDADVTSGLIEQGAEPTPDLIRSCLSDRDRGRLVRLQYRGNLSGEFLQNCAQHLGLLPEQVLHTPKSMCLHGLWKVVDKYSKKGKGKVKLKTKKRVVYPPTKSFLPTPFKQPSTLFEKLRKQDILLHHPYDSFEAFVIWIQQACSDPKVKSIELTVYRIGTLSPIIPALKKASKRKKVGIVIELRARFDEDNNLLIAEELSKAGIRVTFGYGKLKLHAKMAVVTRKEKSGLRLYTHLSTGNYNAKTARQYTDLSILTSHQGIGQDARKFFDAVWKGQIPSGFTYLVQAPSQLHRRLLSLIQTEIQAAMNGKNARIVAKMNALVDNQVIAQLYRASQYGVKIDLIVRGACSLVPQVEGLSKNIRVLSLIDRFLEHSRFYYFESSKQMYLSSADWMPRNFFKRLEIAFPVLDQRIFKYLEQVFIPIHLADTVKARELTAQGTWKKVATRSGDKPIRAQFSFSDIAAKRYKETPLV